MPFFLCRIKCAAESLGNKDANKNRFTNEYIICIENECEDPSSRSDLKLLSWRSANTKSEKTITKVKSIKFHWVFNSQLSQMQNVSWVHNDWQRNENRNLQVEVSIKNRHLLGFVCVFAPAFRVQSADFILVQTMARSNLYDYVTRLQYKKDWSDIKIWNEFQYHYNFSYSNYMFKVLTPPTPVPIY